MKKIFRFVRTGAGQYFFLALFMLFAATPAEGAVNWSDPLGGHDIQKLIGRAIRFSLGYVGLAGLVMFVYGGIQWMLSAGESKQVAKAKDTISYAVMGMAAVAFSYAIVKFLITTLEAVQK